MTIETVGQLINYLQRYNPGMRILKSLPVRGYLPITMGDEPDQTGNPVYHVKSSAFSKLPADNPVFEAFCDAEPQDKDAFEAIVL